MKAVPSAALNVNTPAEQVVEGSGYLKRWAPKPGLPAVSAKGFQGGEPKNFRSTSRSLPRLNGL